MGHIYAFNGCLGATYRRRTWRAAISTGELPSSFDPVISEWGNPLVHGTGVLKSLKYLKLLRGSCAVHEHPFAN